MGSRRLCLTAAAAVLFACDIHGLSGLPPTQPASGGAASAPMPAAAAGMPASAAPVNDPTGAGGTTALVMAAPYAAGSGGSAGSMATTTAVAPTGPAGIVTDPATGELVFRTEPIELAPGAEAYTCYAASTEEDVVVDGFSKGLQTFVHHIQFNRTLLPEPDGLSECNVLFKLTWLPIFLAGNGPSELRLDEGVGHSLPQGTQLLLQLHLLNTGDQMIKQQVEVRMHKSSSPNPTPVSPWAIGSSEINLAARQAGQAQNVCTLSDPVELVAVFPHMHRLGKKIQVEVGKSTDSMKMLYARNPYDFDDQHMEKTHISLQADDVLRVTCDYMNTGDKTVTFGESTNDEMCFFAGFALGDSPGFADCPNLWDALFTLQ